MKGAEDTQGECGGWGEGEAPELCSEAHRWVRGVNELKKPGGRLVGKQETPLPPPRDPSATQTGRGTTHSAFLHHAPSSVLPTALVAGVPTML